jgi:uncharacterized alpha-E superfamily protein
MMLSRVAERLYWMARYLERAEDSARLISAYSHLILDIPRGIEPGWNVLIDTFDAAPVFNTRYRRMSERNVIKFLLADDDNPSSIRSSISSARENVRTTRDVLPAQAWELVNELYLYVSAAAENAFGRNQRFDFLETVIARNQQINGLILTSVSRDHSLWFIKLGQFMERADMTSRIVDVATAAIDSSDEGRESMPEVPLLWANLLRSLSATAAYRRQIGPILTPDEVIDFVLRRRQFPRSIVHCLDSIEETVAQLKAPEGMLRSLRLLLRPITQYRADILDAPQDLHQLIDGFQAQLADLDEAIHDVWFARGPA